MDRFLQDLYAERDEIHAHVEALLRWEAHLERAIKSEDPNRIAYYTGRVEDATANLHAHRDWLDS